MVGNQRVQRVEWFASALPPNHLVPIAASLSEFAIQGFSLSLNAIEWELNSLDA